MFWLEWFSAGLVNKLEMAVAPGSRYLVSRGTVSGNRTGARGREELSPRGSAEFLRRCIP